MPSVSFTYMCNVSLGTDIAHANKAVHLSSHDCYHELCSNIAIEQYLQQLLIHGSDGLSEADQFQIPSDFSESGGILGGEAAQI